MIRARANVPRDLGERVVARVAEQEGLGDGQRPVHEGHARVQERELAAAIGERVEGQEGLDAGDAAAGRPGHGTGKWSWS